MSRPLDPETLVYSLVVAAEPQLSHDGSQIMYLLTAYEPATRLPRSEVWICDADGGAARRLSRPAEVATGPRWAPDSTRIAYVSRDDSESAVHVLDVRTSAELAEVTQHGQLAELAWSPDGAEIACTLLAQPGSATEPSRVTRRLDYKEDGRGFLGDRRKQVVVISVEDGSLHRVIAGDCDHHAPAWSPDGRLIAVSTPPSPDELPELAVVDRLTGVAQVVPTSKAVQQWAWAPNRGAILFAADPDQSLQPDYYLHDVELGTTVRLTDDPGFSPTPPASRPVWLDANHVLIEATRGGASELVVLDVVAGTTEVLERAEARYGAMSADASARMIVQTEASPTSVGEITLFERDTRQRRSITSFNAATLAAHPPAAWERLTVDSDGWAIDAWLLKPPGFDAANRYPVVLDVHGGPTAHYGSGFMAVQQCLATHGFLVVYANPRGSTSYGRAFAQQNVRDWGGGDYQDLMAVLDAVLERAYADPTRTGIYGYSYGGYMTSWAITQTHRFAAAVCGAPIFDLESYWGTSDVGHRGLERYAGGPPHAERAWYASHSPSAFAHLTTTPTLIIQGEDDQRCPVGQGEQMFVALRQSGCEAEFARYPGCSHLFLFTGAPAAREDFLARILGWFTACLHPSD